MPEKNTKERSRKQKDSDTTELALPGFGPFGPLTDFMKPFDELVESFFPSSMRSFFTEFGDRQPDIDIQDRGDHFVLTAELSGFDKKDTEVRVNGNTLELKAERKSESADDERKQASYSYFHRYLTLPEPVLPDKVDGTMKNGVLELRLPKAEPKLADRSKRVALK